MTRGSLRLRLLLAGAVSVLVALALAGFGLTVLFERHVERRVRAELTVYLDQIIAGVDRAPDGDLIVAKGPVDPRFATPLSGLYWQAQIGATTLRSRSLWDGTLALPPDEAGGAVHTHHLQGPTGTRLIVVERSVVLPRRLGGMAMRAAVAVDASDVTAATRAFGVDLLPYLVLLAVFLTAAAYTQIVVGLRPLALMRDRLAAVRAGTVRRLGQGFPQEIVPLANELDALLEAREAQIARARARAGDLAHGLKTPLQVLAGDIDRLRAKGDGQMADEIAELADTMRRHVDRELARARIAGGEREAQAGVAEVVERVVRVLVRSPSGARLEWSVEVPARLAARIDPDDLAEAIGNLAENAARYARRKVTISGRRTDAQAVIMVADDGPGIPEDRVEDALARGGRLDSTGGGAGLGLAIVRDIAEAWDGRLDIRSGAAGLEATLWLTAR